MFQPQYSKRVPADGLHVYAEAIWEKIMTNKDLDLPTQQELLAQFRCEEIANAAFVVFKHQIKEFRHPIEAGQLVEDLGPKMKEARDVATSKSKTYGALMLTTITLALENLHQRLSYYLIV